METAIGRGNEVTGWSFLDFETVKVNRVPVPALGIDRRRGIWIHFARDIGVIARPTIPLLAMLVIGGVAVLLSAAFALFPASAAARTPPARVLRTE
jgi:ABC-type antimicrobial peptide transport system permease subunit